MEHEAIDTRVESGSGLQRLHVAAVPELRLHVGPQDPKALREWQPFRLLCFARLKLQRGNKHGHVNVLEEIKRRRAREATKS